MDRKFDSSQECKGRGPESLKVASSAVFAGLILCAFMVAPASSGPSGSLGRVPLKALVVATSFSGEISPGRRTGCWAEELLAPIDVFRSQGIEVTVSTPLGGPVPFDQASMDSAASTALADPVVKMMVESSIPLERASREKYDIVYISGGHGVLWDLTDNPQLGELIRSHLGAGALVAAVCHGPAALARVRGLNGSPVVSGLRVTGFSLAEERAVGLTAEVASTRLGEQLEGALVKDGGLFEAGPLWAPKVVVSGNLLTGQNPASSRLLSLAAANIALRGWYFLDDAASEVGYFKKLPYRQPPRAITGTTPYRPPVQMAPLPDGFINSGPISIPETAAIALLNPSATASDPGSGQIEGQPLKAGGLTRFRLEYPKVFDLKFTVLGFLEESPLARVPWFDYMREYLLAGGSIVRVTAPSIVSGGSRSPDVRDAAIEVNEAQIPFESQVAGLTLYVSRNNSIPGANEKVDPVSELRGDLLRVLPETRGVKIGEPVRIGTVKADAWTVPGRSGAVVEAALAVAAGEPGEPGYRVIEFCQVP